MRLTPTIARSIVRSRGPDRTCDPAGKNRSGRPNAMSGQIGNGRVTPIEARTVAECPSRTEIPSDQAAACRKKNALSWCSMGPAPTERYVIGTRASRARNAQRNIRYGCPQGPCHSSRNGPEPATTIRSTPRSSWYERMRKGNSFATDEACRARLCNLRRSGMRFAACRSSLGCCPAGTCRLDAPGVIG